MTLRLQLSIYLFLCWGLRTHLAAKDFLVSLRETVPLDEGMVNAEPRAVTFIWSNDICLGIGSGTLVLS